MSPAQRARVVALVAELLDVLASGERGADGAELLTLDAAAQVARCGVRSLRAAIRAGDLAAYGRQRSRAVRRADLEAWIASRRVKPIAGHDDLAMARRMKAIAARRSA
jgi:hypothetical protein